MCLEYILEVKPQSILQDFKAFTDYFQTTFRKGHINLRRMLVAHSPKMSLGIKNKQNFVKLPDEKGTSMI